MFQLLNAPFESISANTGLPLDQAKIAFCLLSSYLLSILFTFINNLYIRHVLSFAIGLLYQLIVYEKETAHTIIISLLVYVVIVMTGRNCVKAAWITAFVYLTTYQIYRYWMDWGAWAMDASFTLMINTAKLTSFAWCYRDGGKDPSKLSEEQNYRKIDKLPSILNFYSYVFFFPCSLIGPIFEYKDWDMLMKKEGRYANAPNGYFLGLKMVIVGALCSLGFESLYGKYFDAEYTITEEFVSQNILWRMGYLFFLGTVIRLKFYSGFFIAQGSVDAVGLSYSGSNLGKHEWEGVLTCGRFTELSINAKECLDQWNKSVQSWLRRYVYDRLLQREQDKGKKPNIESATSITFATSAFWHGVNPSYYLTFFIAWSQVEFSRNFFRAQQNLKLPSIVYNIIQYVVTRVGFGLLLANHMLFYLSKDVILMKTTWAIPIIFPLTMTFLLKISGLTRKPKEKVKDQ